jgi:hypothetical protein
MKTFKMKNIKLNSIELTLYSTKTYIKNGYKASRYINQNAKCRAR